MKKENLNRQHKNTDYKNNIGQLCINERDMEMDRFLQKDSTPRLSQEEIKIINKTS